MRKKFIFSIPIFLSLGFFVFRFFHLFPSFSSYSSVSIVSPLGQKSGGSLSQYSFENLQKRKYAGGIIKLDKIIKYDINFTSFLFFYESDGKKISGLLNLPSGNGPFPVVVLLRGYVDQEIYYTGLGTQKVGEAFAKEGYLALAPDFIGYGSSDPQLSADILEDRFSKPVEVLNLLASIKSLKQANPDKIFLWGHSNGGQIALSVLEISQKSYPTVLWAPVFKGFPEALTDYMHVLDDQGKKVKAAIDKFLLDYDASQYSIITYLKKINSPLQIHQGTADDLVLISRSDEFVSQLKSLDKKVEYFTYQGADHNLSGSAWQTAVSRSLVFFNKN